MGLTADVAILLVVVVGGMGVLVIVGPRWERTRPDEPEHDAEAGEK